MGGRTRRHARAHVWRAAPRGLPLRERAQGERSPEGRSRRDLHADDPRARHRDPGLLADRRAPQRGLRRLLRRGAARPHQRRRREARRHGRWRLPARRCEPAQARRRRGARGDSVRREGDLRAPHGHRGRDARGARRLVARRDAGRERRLPAREARRRAPALHPLYERHHRQAERRAAHDRRLSHPRGHDGQGDLRPEGRRHLLVYGGHRLGDGPLLRRLRDPREWRDDADVRRRADPPATRPLLGDDRAAPREHLLHRAHRDPHLHPPG